MGTAIVILAAGNSSRMGKPKQLLKFNGHSLLDIVINESLKTDCKPIVVVLGAYATEMKLHFTTPEVNFVVNEDWESGMSSSISFGLKTVLSIDNEIENVIITVADQVHISAEIFEDLQRKQGESKKNIVASAYSQTRGTPTLFNKIYFKELLSLGGSNGAKSLIKQHLDDTATIPFDLGRFDIDTETDYNNLINSK